MADVPSPRSHLSRVSPVSRRSQPGRPARSAAAAVPSTVWLAPPQSHTAPTPLPTSRPAPGSDSARVPVSVSVATAAGSSGAVASWPALRGVPAGAVGRVLAAFAPSASVIEVCSADDLAGPPTRNLPTRDLGPDDGVAGQGGEADLLVVEHGCRPAMGGFGPASAGRLAAGGLLAVLTHLDRRDDRTGDPAGSVVAAAQHADLLYLQHIVALHLPVRAGRFTHDADLSQDAGESPPEHRAAPGQSIPGVHRRIHSDVYVFAQPHDHTPPPDLDTAPGPLDGATQNHGAIR